MHTSMMPCTIFLLLLSTLTLVDSAYNPIPIGSVIVSTINRVIVLNPREYGGDDSQTIIYAATGNISIVSSIYDPTPRNLYILFTNSTNGSIYLCQLVSLQKLDTTVYQLPVQFDSALINNLVSFSGDITNRRGFYTNQQGEVQVFAMSGLMNSNISIPTTISSPVRSVTYSPTLNRLFIITDTLIYSCTDLDTDNLQCCQAPPTGTAFRAMTLDQVSGALNAYALDATTGIYQVVLNDTGCPTALRPLNAFGQYVNLQFVIDRGLYFVSASLTSNNDNSLLMIANGTRNPRIVNINSEIVALHISYPVTQTVLSSEEMCFHGLSYTTYRAAIILAAIFGTIMGIFMCFNALFCIDFFMTKNIIRKLKSQIPHDLLEDRWNKLVEEKYAKIALEKQRKKDDPPPRRPSSLNNRQTPSDAQARTTSPSDADGAIVETLQVPNPIPKLSAYLRRKSESYLNRRRSDDYNRQQAAIENRANARIHAQPLTEENEPGKGLRQNLSQKKLLKDDEDFL